MPPILDGVDGFVVDSGFVAGNDQRQVGPSDPVIIIALQSHAKK